MENLHEARSCVAIAGGSSEGVGASASFGISVPICLERQQERRGICLFSVLKRQGLPLCLLLLRNAAIAPHQNTQTTLSGNRVIR